MISPWLAAISRRTTSSDPRHSLANPRDWATRSPSHCSRTKRLRTTGRPSTHAPHQRITRLQAPCQVRLRRVPEAPHSVLSDGKRLAASRWGNTLHWTSRCQIRDCGVWRRRTALRPTITTAPWSSLPNRSPTKTERRSQRDPHSAWSRGRAPSRGASSGYRPKRRRSAPTATDEAAAGVRNGRSPDSVRIRDSRNLAELGVRVLRDSST